MQLILQYRAVAILAAVSAFATIFYLSLWSHLEVDHDSDDQDPRLAKHPHLRPSTENNDQHQQRPPLPQEQKGQEQEQHKIVSMNNARVASLNGHAFAAFCNSKKGPASTDFTSYQQWIEFINHKNRKINSDMQNQRRPRYMERPLRNWIVNLTAMEEPCDRTVHTSAHCLDFLSQEHEYLAPAAQPTATVTPMDFHIFWRGPITDKLSLSAHAFLFTQPLTRAHLHLWIDSADLPGGRPEDYSLNEFSASLVKAPLNKFVTIHAWNQAAELELAYGEENEADQKIRELERQLEPTAKPVKSVALSDEARFLILNRHGGVYLDADVMLLKDMSPFFDAGIEFAYEWSHTRMYNTAILRLFRGSTVARRILDGAKARQLEIMEKKLEEHLERQRRQRDPVEEGDENDDENDETTATSAAISSDKRIHTKGSRLFKRGEMRPEEIYHPARLRDYLRPDGRLEGNGLIMMPPAYFDPLWLRIDGAEVKGSKDTERMVEDLRSFPEAFTEVEAVCPAQQDSGIDFTAGPEVFLTGAYAYHWHNSWLTPIEPKSWMGLMRQAYDDFVEGRRPNLYGEWFQENL
ncbi:hypothetical protein BGZ51_001391 [Haplosporangium sp. Z 767]|nr:hypothetical protein BGZ51_001391 [Haplosporangium sp. Z 767]